MGAGKIEPNSGAKAHTPTAPQHRYQSYARTAPLAERYRQIVEHFEQVARANIGTLVRVADLSRIADINQRTLSRAFHEIHGISPYRYLQLLRLSEVKRILLSEQGTITQAAMQFGFRELGKFGVLYRKAFGESPSGTRRRKQSMQAGSPCDISLVPNDVKEETLLALPDKVIE
jgi:transcriptional regulator GlxA family with amidase domain